LYNSLFTSLPFHRIEKTGILLSLFLNHCEEGYKKRLSPKEIINQFFEKYTTVKNEAEQVDLLFRFIQYAERQVVLFDALEDAAFREINDTMGVGTLKHLESKVLQQGMEAELTKKLDEFVVMFVLTAHPTQFYPGSVLGIINDLSRALKDNNTPLINSYLQQLGKTPLFKKERPTPYDEAISLIWYLENVFYNAVGKIISNLKSQFNNIDLGKNPIIKMGFWPGGDRDGNPNVTSEITLKVAEVLRSSIIKCYYLDVRRLKRRLTFKGIDTILSDLETKLYNNIFIPGSITELSKEEILKPLFQIREIIIYQHNSLFLHLLDDFIYKVQVFGLHFASLDIRQESTVHGNVLEDIALKHGVMPGNYADMNEEEKIAILTKISANIDVDSHEGIIRDTLESMHAVATIQKLNGKDGCSRYIISQCNSVLNVMEVYGLFMLTGWKKEELSVDIVPLFETIEDLKNASGIMRTLYSNEVYAEHLRRRGGKQTIMVGFSDGTKDGGYFMANWSIYKAKTELTTISKEYNIDVVFFDGRGGPPARGGGKTHKYYASIGNRISTKELQLTIQGQTVSSNFGTREAAQYNIEQLLHAGISNSLFPETGFSLNPHHLRILQELADESYKSYKELKEHPQFMAYLSEISPLKYYSETNISSRPAKRGKTSRLTLSDLRAIPFVGAWSQIKQNVPGFYGVGTALEALEKEGKLAEVITIYQQSLYFRTIIDNCEMAMKKTYFPLTAYLADDPNYGELWMMIYEEYERTLKFLAKLSRNNDLMAQYPVDQLSIQMREKIVLPLTTIQQYVLACLREEKELPNKDVLERLIVRTSFGIINAGRNSV
jgi:phosphoenolpyruvate carboxylase